VESFNLWRNGAQQVQFFGDKEVAMDFVLESPARFTARRDTLRTIDRQLTSALTVTGSM
jgi:hypothetical protein